MNLKIYKSDVNFQIEDLLSDDFFHQDSFNKYYNQFMDGLLQTEIFDENEGILLFKKI